MSEHAKGYRARGIVMASKERAMVQTNGAFPSLPREDLIFRGGKTLPQMSYKTLYIGRAWDSGSQADDRQRLDESLAAAMTDPALNEIIGQYFGGSTVTTTPLPSAILDIPLQQIFDKGDIHALAEQTFMSGALTAVDFRNTVINFILPPGAVLSSDGGGEASLGADPDLPPGFPREGQEEESSLQGLGGYHGSIHIQRPGTPVTVYYSVAVWSNDRNGIAIPGWEPWENACATLYHELVEARTDPDVEDAIRTGDIRSIGWNSNSGNEIGDFPIEEAGRNLPLVFRKVPVAGPLDTVPIQLMWSNRVHGPEAPGAAPSLTAAAVQRQNQVIAFGATASTPPAQVAGITLSPPGNLKDFQQANSATGWNALLSSFFDSAIAATQVKLKGLPSQFFNPSKGSPGSAVTELPIKWPGFPRLLENSNLPPTEQLRQAELILGTFLGRMRHQDEYLEWFVTRSAKSKKITRIDFTCEGPEYWDFLASTEPDVLLDLYQKHVSHNVKLTDLITNGQYNPLNVWNTRRGAMHLIQPNNSLNAEVRIAGDATILRKNADGSLKTEAQDLIDCARYGEPGRASDPHIGDLVNGLARNGFMISLRNPVGLYMSRPRLLGCATPDGNPVTQDWFKITRGSEDFILHGVFEAPAGSAFVVGDVAIGGVPVAFGGQIAKLIDMGLTGIAFGKGSIKNPAFACEPALTMAVSALGVTRHLGRFSS